MELQPHHFVINKKKKRERENQTVKTYYAEVSYSQTFKWEITHKQGEGAHVHNAY